jgi:hypothetical protein
VQYERNLHKVVGSSRLMAIGQSKQLQLCESLLSSVVYMEGDHQGRIPSLLVRLAVQPSSLLHSISGWLPSTCSWDLASLAETLDVTLAESYMSPVPYHPLTGTSGSNAVMQTFRATWLCHSWCMSLQR